MPLALQVCNRYFFRFLYSGRSNVRVRFAPSPTGFLHLGGLRTALYNYLFAKKNGGKFVLRIEDTDQKRVKVGSVENLNSVLEWTGLLPDESPSVGGPSAPYIQSERLEIYKEKANILLKKGIAYRCFCSETRLNILRKEAQMNRVNFGYDNKCRHLTPADEKKLIDEGKPFTIRFKIPEGQITHRDLVYGESIYHLSEHEGDFIILKSDGYPTYHFSCVVDDHLMEISHVLRGTEWLVSTPKHILLHQAFGWMPPKFAHLPLFVNSDRSKLSKRQEAIGIEYFKNKGYFPESLINFLAAVGGAIGKNEAHCIHDLPTLCSKFQLENLSTSSCIVDLKKLDEFNHSYIVKHLSDEMLAASLIKKLREILLAKYGQSYAREEQNLPDSSMLKILLVYKDRINNLLEFLEKDFEYLWTAPDINVNLERIEDLKVADNVVYGWKSVLSLLISLPEKEFTQSSLAVKLKEISLAENIPYGPLMRSLRVVLTRQMDGPGIAEILAMLGKTRSVNKITAVIKEIDKKIILNQK